MKKLVCILFLLLLVPLGAFSLSDLEKANVKISQLEKEVQLLKDSIKEKDRILSEAERALDENNIVLAAAGQRIDKDQEEIVKLRIMIKDLISTGVEITTYHWSIMFKYGYPTSTGIAVAYNFHFLPSAGLVAGFDYNWVDMKPLMTVGLKINLK